MARSSLSAYGNMNLVGVHFSELQLPNEKGNFQLHFCCVVPPTFPDLYVYFILEQALEKQYEQQ